MERMNQEEKETLMEYLVQFSNLEKYFPFFQGVRDPEAIADFIGLEYSRFSSIRQFFDEQSRKAAEDILKDKEVLDWVEELPLKSGDKLAVLADSITDDRQSWFRILEHLLNLAVPKASFKYIDSSLSNSLSADAMRRMEREVFALKPDWVFIALGSDDAMQLHLSSKRTLVSVAEFWENINVIESAVMKNCSNPPIWITPPPAIPEMMIQMPLLDGVLDEQNLKQFREVVSGKSGYVVDPTGGRMGIPPQHWYYLNDGFHPSLAGHMQTVKCILKTFASTKHTRRKMT